MSHNMTEREMQIFMCRLYLKEARARAKNPKARSFCFTLIQWAENCRQRAMKLTDEPPQRELF